MWVRVRRQSKIGHFCMQNRFLNFFQEKKSILPEFGWFFRLRGQFLEPKLRPIVLAMEQAIVRHVLRNILGSEKDRIGAGTPTRMDKAIKTWSLNHDIDSSTA